ncbi:MAG: family 16 glycoside hydrolase, partial [Verrucomicrobiota bacterium]
MNFERLFHPAFVTFSLVAGLLSARAAESLPVDVIVPKEKIVLFGKEKKSLDAFYKWLPKFGVNNDPDKVFTVVDQVDGAPAIRSSGQHWGGVVTHANYANYKLVTEFRWGLVTWDPRANKTRDSGILLHGQGPDGNAAKDFKSPWMRSVEYQILEGGTGDIILVNGFDHGSDKIIAPRLLAKVRDKNYWDPAGVMTEFTKSRINWQYRDVNWKDTLGYRGPKDVEKTVGEWNRIEAYCSGG